MKIKKYILSIAMLLMVTITAWANEVEESGLHCEDVVTITATPETGHKFVRWSDGNTDNPRTITIEQAVDLTAIFEPADDCTRDIVPVVYMYEQLLLVHVDSLERMGYTFTETDVNWYRVIGQPDPPTGITDDVPVAAGYYLNLTMITPREGAYYARVDVTQSQTSFTRCEDILLSAPRYIGTTGLDDLSANDIRLIPTITTAGSPITILGLPTHESVTIRVYDAAGQLLEETMSDHTESVILTAQRAAGCYLVRVRSKEGEEIRKYIVR